MRARIILALLSFCSAAPAPFDKNNAKHTHDRNGTRNQKVFDNSQINMGDLTVDSATGDNTQIGHTLDINVVQTHRVQSVEENADDSQGHAPAPELSHDGDFEERLHRLFKSMDADEDGVISVTELIRICNENNIYITELEAQSVLTLPDETVPFTLPYFLAILDNVAFSSSSDTGELIQFLLQSAGSQDHLMFDKNLMNVFLAFDVDHDCQLFVPDILAVFQDLGNPMLLDEAKSLLSGHHGHNHHDGVDFSLWKKLILGEVFKKDDLMLLDVWRDAFIEVKKSFITGIAVAVSEGKPLCKGKNFPDGQECCESEDPEGTKCVEGQGDCDSDEGCAGDLICGTDNCMKYNPLADPQDDCCTPKFVGDVMRTNVENVAKTAVKALKHGSELGECYQGELLKVESSSVEVKEGLLYKLQLRISTMGGEDCMESREMICEHIMMTKPLPKDCKGSDALELINREDITCEKIEAPTPRVLWTLLGNDAPGEPSQTFELPSLTPVNSDCKVTYPGMDGHETLFQEVEGNVYGCNYMECKQYFPEENTWTTIPDMKFVSERQYAAGALVGDKWVVQGGEIYVNNGVFANVETAEVWTPGAEKWVEAPEFRSPLPVMRHCIVTLDDKLMQIGGFSYYSGRRSSCFLGGKEVASLKAPRDSHACAVFQGQVWVAGGDRGGYMTDDAKDVVEIYDPDTNIWRVGPKRPETAADVKPQLVENSGQLFYIGGDKIGKIYKLNKNKDDWEEVGDVDMAEKFAAILLKKTC